MPVCVFPVWVYLLLVGPLAGHVRLLVSVQPSGSGGISALVGSHGVSALAVV